MRMVSPLQATTDLYSSSDQRSRLCLMLLQVPSDSADCWRVCLSALPSRKTEGPWPRSSRYRCETERGTCRCSGLSGHCFSRRNFRCCRARRMTSWISSHSSRAAPSTYTSWELVDSTGESAWIISFNPPRHCQAESVRHVHFNMNHA